MDVFFVKMQESGSDYICIDCLDKSIDKKIELAVRMSRRHTGIGADGLIFIYPSGCAACRVEVYNADGSRNTDGVNGIRCAARYMYDHHKGHLSQIRIEADRGIRNVSMYNHLKVKMDIGGIENFGEKRIPYPMQLVQLGNTHCILFMDEIKNMILEDVYKEIRKRSLFGENISVEAAVAERVVESGDIHIKMRVWENGMGEMLSSSAAACAVSAAAVWQGYCRYDENIQVCQPGGVLTTAYLCDGRMMLEGPAEYVCEGVWKC